MTIDMPISKKYTNTGKYPPEKDGYDIYAFSRLGFGSAPNPRNLDWSLEGPSCPVAYYRYYPKQKKTPCS